MLENILFKINIRLRKLMEQDKDPVVGPILKALSRIYLAVWIGNGIGLNILIYLLK
jgi:hypothetical protein